LATFHPEALEYSLILILHDFIPSFTPQFFNCSEWVRTSFFFFLRFLCPSFLEWSFERLGYGELYVLRPADSLRLFPLQQAFFLYFYQPPPSPPFPHPAASLTFRESFVFLSIYTLPSLPRDGRPSAAWGLFFLVSQRLVLVRRVVCFVSFGHFSCF